MVPIGKILRTHGYKGKIRITFHPVFAEDLNELEGVLIELNGIGMLPFIITEREIISEKEALITLEEINSMEAARPLCGKTIFAREEDIKHSVESNPYMSLTGYMAIDNKEGSLGKITDVLELPGQVLAEINRDGRKILVPLNEIFIKAIDRKKKILLLELPDGLIDINL